MDLKELQELYNNLKANNPQALTDPFVQILSQPQKEAVEQVEANPDEPKAPITNTATNPFDLTTPPANTVPANFDVSAGLQPSTMKLEGQIGDITPPPAPASVNPELPALMEQNPDAIMPPEAPKTAPEPRKEASKGKGEKNPLDVILEGTSNKDYDARQAFEESERKKHTWGALPMGLAGIGDAISNAASAYGAKGTTGGLERVQATLMHGEKLRKEQFDQKLLTDPNSEISQHYRDTLALMMSTKPNDPKIANLSAEQIKQTMPEVDKFITHQLQREANKQAKEFQFSEKQQQFDDRQWERLGKDVNNLKASSRWALGQATTNNMRADRFIATTQMKVITSQDYSNLVADLQGIYKGGVPDQVMLQHGDYATIQRKAGEMLQFITGKPQNINTPEIKQHLLDLTRDIKRIDNKIINDNLGINAIVYRRLIEKDPARWNDLMEAVKGTTDEPLPATGHGTVGATSSATTPAATGEVRRKMKDGKVAVFDATTKQFIRYE